VGGPKNGKVVDNLSGGKRIWVKGRANRASKYSWSPKKKVKSITGLEKKRPWYTGEQVLVKVARNEQKTAHPKNAEQRKKFDAQ